MPLVFVHGVNVRYGDPAQDRHVQARTALFRRFALAPIVADPAKSLILNPYWGHLAARFPWHHGGLPVDSYEAFGEDDDVLAPLLLVDAAAADDPDKAILTAARTSFESAVDALWTVASEDLEEATAQALAGLADQVAAYVEANPSPKWLRETHDDAEFLSRLTEAAQQWARTHQDRGGRPGVVVDEGFETFGMDQIGERLRAGLARIRSAAVGAGGTLRRAGDGIRDAGRSAVDSLVLRARAPIHRTVTTFLGDAFVYFRQREQGRSAIADAVADDLDRAAAVRTATGEPLIVIAHSMGGVIMYDLLTSVRRDRAVDMFVSVGSQIAVMEELKLFASSNRAVPNPQQPKVARPPNIARWVNVFDTRDILGFVAGRVFDGVTDHAFATGRAWAHSGYFVEPLFHRRLAARLR